MKKSKKELNRITAALISVSDKTGIKEFAQNLARSGIVIYSSGGTYSYLKKEGLDVRKVEHLTHFTEILEGRVKTLHPAIHASILYRRNHTSDSRMIRELSYVDLRLVVVNLYPFERTIKSGKANTKSAIENIDIGGVALIRAAAKNHEWVTVVSDINDYEKVIQQIRYKKNTDSETRRYLAIKAFRTTAHYDLTISNYFSETYFEEKNINLHFQSGRQLRYGENPHQKAWIYSSYNPENYLPQIDNSSPLNHSDKIGPINQQPTLTGAEILNGKAMSYNNYLDAEAALACVWDFFPSKAAVVVKHGNPCGLATGDNLATCLEMAWEGDPVSAYGGIVATNQTFDFKSIRFLNDKFIEVILAPDFEPKALAWLKKQSKNLRIIRTPQSKVLTETNLRNMKISKIKNAIKELTYHFITGGILVQEKDQQLYSKMSSMGFKKKERMNVDLYEFSFRTVKHLKSNAICICYPYQNGQFMLLGAGTGQPNRIDSIKKLAAVKAKDNLSRMFPQLPKTELETLLHDCVLASDAFFPFKDSIVASYDCGIRKIIQPGGSIRDDEVIAEAKKRKIELVFTSTRHFLH